MKVCCLPTMECGDLGLDSCYSRLRNARPTELRLAALRARSLWTETADGQHVLPEAWSVKARVAGPTL